MNKLINLVFALSVFSLFCSGKDKETKSSEYRDVLSLEKTITLPGVSGRIDHMSIDAKNQILYVAALGNNSIEAVDLQKGERTNSIKDIEEPQGVLYIKDNNTLCATSGGTGNCNFYDAKTLALIKTIFIGPDADNMRYDTDSKIIFAGYGEGGLTEIDALKETLVSSVTFTGHPEAFQPDRNRNRIYVNVPSANSIIVIDSKSNSVINRWDIADASSNFPMALDGDDHRIFIGCRKPPVLIVYDTESGKEITRFEIKGDVDDIFYDSDKKLVYLSCGEGYFEVFKQNKMDNYELVQEINTSKGARTCLFIPELNEICIAVPQTGDNDAGILLYRINP